MTKYLPNSIIIINSMK